MTVKTDRKDARGIAQLLRMGWFRSVHCKSSAEVVRGLLVGRKLLQSKLCSLAAYGLGNSSRSFSQLS